MPYQYICEDCGRKFRADSEKEIISRAQNHLDRRHDEDLNSEDALQEIEQI